MDTPGQHKQVVTKDDLSVDFDKFISDPGAVDTIKQILEGERRKKNTMSVAEFKQYERLFQYDGMSIIGEQQFRDLATRYFHTISIYDPVIVMDGNTVVMELPPIFNRYNPIDEAGNVGIDINQAFINACKADDPMAEQRVNKYAEFYKRLISAVNNEEVRKNNEIKAKEQSEKVVSAAKSTMQVREQDKEIESIRTSIFKSTEIESLFDSTTIKQQDDDDEFSPL